MISTLTAWSERIDNASLRERVLVFTAAALTLVAGFYLLLISPLLSEASGLTQRNRQQSAELAALQREERRLSREQSASSAVAEAARRVDALRAQLAALERRAAEEQLRFTPPERIRAVLEEMLARNKRLTLVELKTLPLVTLSAGKPGQGEQRVFQHGIELTVKGRYADLYEYLRALERLPTKLYWGRAQLSAEDYPVDVLKLTLYTVSFDRAWMVV
ncbi:MAG: type II secretion system protein GspM [Betaproteobacteria bacterium]|nr:type II secretion system protein GspM [Betaproteobacteria bacterium]